MVVPAASALQQGEARWWASSLEAHYTFAQLKSSDFPRLKLPSSFAKRQHAATNNIRNLLSSRARRPHPLPAFSGPDLSHPFPNLAGFAPKLAAFSYRLRRRSPIMLSAVQDDDLDLPHQTLIPRSHNVTAKSGTGSAGHMSVSLKDDGFKDGKYTVEDAVEFMGFGRFQALVLVYAGMAWVADAMEMMLLSFVGPAVQKSWNLTPSEEGMITSVVFIGMMFGAYFWGALSDLKGRRSGFLFTALVTFGAGLLSAFAPNYYALLFLRGIVGVGLAGGAVITSWFLEFIPTSNRGLWMVLISVFWTIGTVVEATLAWIVMPSLGWRWLLGLSSVPLLVLLVFYPLVPESPRYLVAKGKADEALVVLRSVARINKKPLPVGQLYQENAIAAHDHGRGDLIKEALRLVKALFSSTMIRSTLLLWLVFFANAFTYYGLVLLTTQLSDPATSCGTAVNAAQSVGESTDLYKGALVTSFAELPGLLVSAAIVDRFGRKKSMSGLFLVCAAALLPLVQPLAATTTTLLLFLARACITGTFTIVYIYAPEVYPTELRATGLGVSNSFARIGGVLCPLVAVELVKNCQLALAVTLFVGVPLLGAVAVAFLPIETSGRLLTDTVEETKV